MPMLSDASMNRDTYFTAINQSLTGLAMQIHVNGRLNLLDLHVHSENFYLHLFNLIFGYNLENLNILNTNIGGIDLVDHTRKIVIQISASDTKHKIESALSKVPTQFHGYRFLFIPIVADASELKDLLQAKPYKNPYKMIFNPTGDIFDVAHILRYISSFPIDKLEEIHLFLKKELKQIVDPLQIQSNLADIINILSKDDLSGKDLEAKSIDFEIEDKIKHNKLDSSRKFIDDFFVYHPRVEKIYSEYDKQGVNKSLSVTAKLRTIYCQIDPAIGPDAHFDEVISRAIEYIKGSSNFVPIPEEELELCVQILTVDAFIRCKIFERPPRPTNANS